VGRTERLSDTLKSIHLFQMYYNKTMKTKDINKLQEEIEQDEKRRPRSAEKKLKINKSFDEVLKKMVRPKKHNL
jgi:predicted CopG family antitoxin